MKGMIGANNAGSNPIRPEAIILGRMANAVLDATDLKTRTRLTTEFEAYVFRNNRHFDRNTIVAATSLAQSFRLGIAEENWEATPGKENQKTLLQVQRVHQVIQTAIALETHPIAELTSILDTKQTDSPLHVLMTPNEQLLGMAFLSLLANNSNQKLIGDAFFGDPKTHEAFKVSMALDAFPAEHRPDIMDVPHDGNCLYWSLAASIVQQPDALRSVLNTDAMLDFVLDEDAMSVFADDQKVIDADSVVRFSRTTDGYSKVIEALQCVLRTQVAAHIRHIANDPKSSPDLARQLAVSRKELGLIRNHAQRLLKLAEIVAKPGEFADREVMMVLPVLFPDLKINLEVFYPFNSSELYAFNRKGKYQLEIVKAPFAHYMWSDPSILAKFES